VASKTVVELFDDLDGGRADETVIFALDGVEYEIDLSTANAATLRDGLAEYIGHGHKVTGRTKRAPKPAPEPVPEPVQAVKPAPKATKPAVRPSNNSMTAEIRRLASESARKVSEAQKPVEVQDAEPDLFSTAPPDIPAAERPTRPVERQPEEVGPVRALIIPFQEAGL
jgi:hypothetical protein